MILFKSIHSFYKNHHNIVYVSSSSEFYGEKNLWESLDKKQKHTFEIFENFFNYKLFNFTPFILNSVLQFPPLASSHPLLVPL